MLAVTLCFAIVVVCQSREFMTAYNINHQYTLQKLGSLSLAKDNHIKMRSIIHEVRQDRLGVSKFIKKCQVDGSDTNGITSCPIFDDDFHHVQVVVVPPGIRLPSEQLRPRFIAPLKGSFQSILFGRPYGIQNPKPSTIINRFSINEEDVVVIHPHTVYQLINNETVMALIVNDKMDEPFFDMDKSKVRDLHNLESEIIRQQLVHGNLENYAQVNMDQICKEINEMVETRGELSNDDIPLVVKLSKEIRKAFLFNNAQYIKDFPIKVIITNGSIAMFQAEICTTKRMQARIHFFPSLSEGYIHNHRFNLVSISLYGSYDHTLWQIVPNNGSHFERTRRKDRSVSNREMRNGSLMKMVTYRHEPGEAFFLSTHGHHTVSVSDEQKTKIGMVSLFVKDFNPKLSSRVLENEGGGVDEEDLDIKELYLNFEEKTKLMDYVIYKCKIFL